MVTTASRAPDAVKDRDGIGVLELSDCLSISRNTAYTHLRMLEEGGLLVQRGDRYRPVFKSTVLGKCTWNQNLLYRYDKPEVEKLTAETDQHTHIVTEEGGYGVNLYQVRGDTNVDGEYQTEKVQNQDHLHYAVSGEAILATPPDERVEKVTEQRGLPMRMKATITDREVLFSELGQTRERGYAYNDEEEIRGFRAINASIKDPSGQALGSVSVSDLTSLLQGEQF